MLIRRCKKRVNLSSETHRNISTRALLESRRRGGGSQKKFAKALNNAAPSLTIGTGLEK